MPVTRGSDLSIQRLKTWAEPLHDTVDSALSKALDAAEAKRQADGSQPGWDPGKETRLACPASRRRTPAKSQARAGHDRYSRTRHTVPSRHRRGHHRGKLD